MPEETKPETEIATPEDDVTSMSLGEFIKDLNMEEIDFVETISGCSLDELEVPGRAKGLFIAGVALVAKRRSQPDFSWGEARALNMAEIEAILGEAATVKKVKGKATKSVANAD